MTAIWQIAAGTSDRDYSALFLEHDLAFMGPGRFGPAHQHGYAEHIPDPALTAGKRRMVVGFGFGMSVTDPVVLRVGREARAIGIVRGNYFHHEAFAEVDGWDLQHVRPVAWQVDLSADLVKLQSRRPLFANATRMPTFSRVRDAASLAALAPLIAEIESRAAQIMNSPEKPIPRLPSPIDHDDLGQLLFARGLANDAVDGVLRALDRARRLADWYRAVPRDVGRPTEHEIVAHMVLPMLLALGWSEQLLAVEWRQADLAGFAGTPTRAENCVLLCEAKGHGEALGSKALQQALGYVERRGLVNCHTVMLTDGTRFVLYGRPAVDAAFEPRAYMNVLSLRTEYLTPARLGVVDAIAGLAPWAI